MSRKALPIGHEETTPQGYIRVKTKDGWRLKHWLIAEEKIGRAIDRTCERVTFVDGNRDNLNSENIAVVPTNRNKAQRAQLLRDRIAVLQAELRELEDSE